MALDLPPKDQKDASKDGEKAEPKPRVTSSGALAARVTKLEKLVDALADSAFGKNLRPVSTDDEEKEENGA